MIGRMVSVTRCVLSLDAGPFIVGIDRLVSSRRCVIVGGVLGSAGFIIGSQSTTVLQLTLSIVILSGSNIYCSMVIYMNKLILMATVL